MSLLTVYYKFTSCCDGTEIFFRGPLSIVDNTVYKYVDIAAFPGSGGSLQPGFCYTVTSFISATPYVYPAAPSAIYLSTSGVTDCGDAPCAPCTPPLVCSCPEGYELIDDECVLLATVEANYTGGLLTVGSGNHNADYNKFGLRLYDDISSATYPILGAGTSNANYTVKDDNGAGSVITQLANVKSNLWGSDGACATGTTGGRLNISGLWAAGYPDNQELCFDFCVEPEVTKQYLIGIAGDNEVRLYIDGVLTVNLTSDAMGSVSVPFTRWHVFPITLSADKHTITLCGLNKGQDAAFGAEIYDIDLATFQSTLLTPGITPPNCGNIAADITPYVIFSTVNMIGLQVPNPNDPGVWECPEGYTLDECQGVPLCSIETRFTLICPCYLLIPCDGVTAPFISSTSGLSDYLNEFVTIEAPDFDGCVYVVELDDNNCEDAIDVIIDGDIPCVCDTVCYYIEGAQGISYIQYIDDQDQLIDITPAATAPWLTLCSKVYPIVGNSSSNYTITPLGDCTDNQCPEKCFKLTDCNNPVNIIYSNSYNLLFYAINNLVVKITGHTECWIVETTTDPCDCAIDVIVEVAVSSCNICKDVIAYKLTSCDGSYDIQYTYSDLSDYVGTTVLTDCGCFTVEQINYAPPSVQVIEILASFDSCYSCQRPYYKLTDCSTEEEIYTYTDLSDSVGLIVKLTNCDNCWEVSNASIPIDPGTVDVENTYPDCITCVTSAPCVCSTVRNDNDVEYTFAYLDCYGDTQTITLLPGATSNRICLIKWLEPEDCNCLIDTFTIGSSVTNTVLDASGILVNNRPTWYLEASLYIYYNGSQWIRNNEAGEPEYYLTPSNSYCPEGTWHAISSIPTEEPITYSTVKCQAYYKFYGDCINGKCPAPVYPRRSVKPGYDTPYCSTWKYEEITCKSAELLYKQVLEARYGITNCCPEADQEDWLVKKQLIDLDALRNPDYNCTPVSSCCNRPVSSCNCGN